MNSDVIGDQVRFTAPCPECRRDAPAQGGQGLVFGRLEWGIETECPACGPIASCGRRDLPAALRELLLRQHPTQLVLAGDGDGQRAVIMKVIRSELALDLSGAREILNELLAGRHSGTMPEIEKLARALRADGVDARAVRRPR